MTAERAARRSKAGVEPVHGLRRLAGIVLAGMAVSVLAGCGGSSGQTATPTSQNGGNGFGAYMSCLGRHGVKLPSFAPRANPSGFPSTRPSRSPGRGGFDGGSGAGRLNDPNNPPQGVDAPTWKAALAACQSLRPTSNGRGGQNNGAFMAYRNCLADHGVKTLSGPGALSTTDPKVAAALKTCAPLRPTRQASPTPSS